MQWITRFLVTLALLVLSLRAFAQNEAGFVVNGTFSGQPNQGAFTPLACPLTGCSPTASASHVNSGVALEGFLAHSISNFHVASLSLELPVSSIPSRGTNLAGSTYSTFAVTPGLRASLLAKSSLSPFLSAGGGFAHFSGDSTAVRGAVAVGGGVDLKTRLPRLGFRIQVKDLITPWPSLFPKSGVMNNVMTGGGVVFRF